MGEARLAEPTTYSIHYHPHMHAVKYSIGGCFLLSTMYNLKCKAWSQQGVITRFKIWMNYYCVLSMLMIRRLLLVGPKYLWLLKASLPCFTRRIPTSSTTTTRQVHCLMISNLLIWGCPASETNTIMRPHVRGGSENFSS
jgi:hypothetical protein